MSNEAGQGAEQGATGGGSSMVGGTGHPAPQGTPDPNGVAAQQGQQGTAVTPDPAPNGAPWHGQLTESMNPELAGDFSKIVGRYQTPDEFAKGMVEQNKSFHNRVPIPAPDASDEDFEAFASKMRPEAPTEYKFNHDPKAPPLEPSEEAGRESFREVAHKAGLNQRQLDMLTQWNDSFRTMEHEAFATRGAQAEQTHESALKAELGANYDQAVGNYQSTLAQVLNEQERQEAGNLMLADGSYVFDHPIVVKYGARMGGMMAEDDRHPTAMNAGVRESAKEEYERLRAESVEKGLSPSSDQWPTQRLQQLSNKINGSATAGVASLVTPTFNAWPLAPALPRQSCDEEGPPPALVV